MHRKPQNLADAARVCDEQKSNAESEYEHVTKCHVAAKRQNNRAQESDEPQCVSDVGEWSEVVGMLKMARHAKMPRAAKVVGRRDGEKGKEGNPCRAVGAKKLKDALHA